MEYADILERHRVLYGADVTEGIIVSRPDLRLEVEQQALGKLLHLRRGAMAAGGDGVAQLELMEASLSALMVVFRGVSRLHGEIPPQDYSALSSDIAKKAGFEDKPLLRVVQHVRGSAKLKKEEAPAVLAGYMASMEALVAYLNDYAA
jgi:hypothetical protein